MRYEDERFAELERKVDRLVTSVERLESRVFGPEVDVPTTPATPSAVQPESAVSPPPAAMFPPSRPAVSAQRRAPTLDLEDLLGARVLAWVGGSAIFLGVVFFLVMAVKNGWIDEPTRVLLAFVGSSLLLGSGLYLYERRGRTEAAIAAVASSIAALYASLTVGTQLYDLIAPALGLLLAGLVGATATAIAVRWDARLVGALGILGALVSPVLVDADTSGITLLFMAVALLSATGVLLWQRWDWLAAAAFLVSAPQLLLWIDDTYRDEVALALGVLLAFWAIYVVAAIGYEIRVRTASLRPSSALLLLANALLAAGAGYYVLQETDHDGVATAWVVLLALAHIGLGAWSFHGRVSREIALLVIAVGIGLSGVALALALNGPALVAGWSAEAALLAWIARRSGDRRAHLAVGVFLALAAIHILTIEAPPEALREGVDDLARAVVALLAFAVAAVFAASQYRGEPRETRSVLEALAASTLVYLPSLVIVDLTSMGEAIDSFEPIEPGQTPQVLLSAFWSLTGVAAVILGLFRNDRRLRIGGFSLLAVAVVKVFVFDLAELDSIYRVASFIALGLLLLAGAFAYQRLRVTEPGE